ncbi:MAG: 4'-phosphopantetheinyl transferase superfamily protein [Clostridia bacterium]|nr:4'-phosphopantetheinyl transferase superfamily protein [Clostridia bacterium]
MLYIAYCECENTATDRHNKAYDLLNQMLLAAGINGPVKKAPSGKPYIEDDKAFISLSHSGSAVCCALSCDEKIDLSFLPDIIIREDKKSHVGVDIEKIVPNRDMKKIADRFFTADEQEIAKTDITHFYRVYTRKESMAKATGRGIAELRRQPSTLARDGTYTYNINLPTGDYILSVSLL